MNESKFRYLIFPEHVYTFQFGNIKYEVIGSEVLNIVKQHLKIDDIHSSNDTHQTK